MTGFLIILMGAGIGTVGSILNPFKIPIAVDAINEAVGTEVLTTTTGIAFRVIGFILLISIGITFVMLYARKIKINASSSTVYSIKDTWKTFELQSTPDFTSRRKASFIIFCLSFVVLIFTLLDRQSFWCNCICYSARLDY